MKSVLIDVEAMREKLGNFLAGDRIKFIAHGMTGTMHIDEEYLIQRIDKCGSVKLIDMEGDSRYTTLGDLYLNVVVI